jgi:hypothetical protein
VKQDGAAYGNNTKVVYLSLGSYIDDAKGTGVGTFELTSTLSTNGAQRGASYNFLSFGNVSSPAAATDSHAIGSIGINAQADSVAYSYGPGMGAVSTTNTAIDHHVVTIALDVTPTSYDGATKFGKITLSDSVAGPLGSRVLTADQSFASLSLLVAAGINTGIRTDSKYGSLTLSQIIPESAKGMVLTVR